MNDIEFISKIEVCPICNSAASCHLLDTLRNSYILSLCCLQHKAIYYETYYFISKDNIVIDTFSMHINNHIVSWIEKNKTLYIREQDGKVLFYKQYQDKSSHDWLFMPYKNVITKANSIMLML